MVSSRRSIFFWIFSCIVLKECKGGEIRGYPPPSHCSPKLDCPKYNVIHSEKEFEIRSYSQALWVTAPPVAQNSIMEGSGRAEDDLFWYYYRRNDQGVLIINTGPVSMLEVFNSTYKAFYYVPEKYQKGGLPKPETPKITQVKLPEHKYAAVRRVNEEVLQDKVLAQLDRFRKSLKGSSYERAASSDRFTFTLYDGRFFGPEYELLIWFD